MRKLVSGAILAACGGIPINVAWAQCPAVGADSGCGTVITITQTGATVTAVPGVGPYDGSDDTLVGVVNNIPACTAPKSQSACGISIYSLDLTSTQDIFGFDGDGIDTYGITGNSQDSTGYGGPNVFFTNYSTVNYGRVNFITPIPPGGTAFFSLENALNSASACTSILNNSIQGGANVAAYTPPPVGTGPNVVNTVGIRATFVPQGTDPNTGNPYTIAAAAAACGFTNFDWQQTITSWPAPSNLYANCSPNLPTQTGIVAPPPFNDPPLCGYYAYPGQSYPPNAVGIPVYYNVYSPTTPPFGLTVNQSLSATPNYLSFFDAPNDPLLPAGGTLNFTTHLVGILGPGPTYSVADTGVGFTWTSNHAGAAGGVTITQVDPTGPIDTSGTGGVTITGVTQTSTYTGVGVAAINGSTNIFGTTSLLAAVLPESRSAQVSGTVTAFATIINSGATTATACSIAPAGSPPAAFHYQTTDPTTNQVTGTVDTPVDIAAGASQTFVFGITPTAAITPADLALTFNCTNTTPAPVYSGVDTLLLSASTTPTPDVVALSATVSGDGILHIPGAAGSYEFAVATINLGSGDTIVATTTTNGATLPVTLTICQTDPTSGQCLSTPAANVQTTIGPNTTPTFGIFAQATGAIPFDPANSRIFVTFTDSTGAVRGETSVAVETQ